MLKNILTALMTSFLFILCVSSLAQAQETKKISYTLDYQKGDVNILTVTFQFEGDESGRTPVSLPMPWGGLTEAHKGLSAISCLNAGCTVSPADNTETAVFVDHTPGELITLGYTVTRMWNGEYRNEVRYLPNLADDYLFLIGHAFLATPDNYQGHPIELTLNWTGIPGNWAAMTSFGVGKDIKTVVPDMDEMRSGIFTAGDYRVFGDEIKGVYTFVAIRGDWEFSDQEFKSLTTDTIREIRAFWNDYNADQFLVTLLPMSGYCCNLSGTALNDSFSLFVTNDGVHLGQFEGLLSHELLHEWLGGALTLEGAEEHGYWFTEGFTNYYSRLLRLRAGRLDLLGYAEDYNRTIADYFTSSARNATLEDVEANFWTDRDTGNLPYQRGDIIAHNWNAGIKDDNDGTSLDTAMHDLFSDPSQGPRVLTLSALNSAISKHLERTILTDVQNYLVEGKTVELDPTALGRCFVLEDVELFPFDLGFTYEPSAKEGVYWVITGVTPGSPAEAAGLKAGMEVGGYSFSYGDTVNPAEIYIWQDGERVKYEFVAKGQGVMVPQYVLDEREYRKHRDECEAFFQN